MKTNYKDISIILVTYNSNFEIENILKKLSRDIKIIIIENSQNYKIKNYFENKYKNISVIVNNRNTGQTGGINLGFKNVKTKYCIYMDMDVIFKIDLIDKFYEIAEKIKDFCLIVPPHNKSSYPKSYELDHDLPEFTNLQKMKIVHGYFMFFKMSAVIDVGFYDENIFFYYDETDYCLRINKCNHKIYIFKEAIVEHKEGKSYDKSTQIKIEPIRQWHLMWGKYYFNKKHYGVFKAYTKTLPNLFECLLKIPILFFINKNNCKNYCYRLLGLFNAYMGRSSWKRI